jgi:hypothetical protein
MLLPFPEVAFLEDRDEDRFTPLDFALLLLPLVTFLLPGVVLTLLPVSGERFMLVVRTLLLLTRPADRDVTLLDRLPADDVRVTRSVDFFELE